MGRVPKDIEDWIDSLSTPYSFAEDTYNRLRDTHEGELPRHLKAAWNHLPTSYRDLLVAVSENAFKEGQRRQNQ